MKINMALLAMVLGISAAFAFKPAEPKKFSVVYRRIATAATKETSNTWVQGAPTASCLSATKICTATFADGYNPNEHSYEDNVANATSVQSGYRPN
ncbi:hypothetical protein D0C36_22985 [Mucilaginibacter conchicola]|uniref:Uncharacterized protein n=2 Tax=Mucilaginibacter conchicola TaxID=2303333 RepID=A0A372NN87_9SPHI|nr:hypothetical protein D0C36_22985 [Mucilaginibacter conchicola]